MQTPDWTNVSKDGRRWVRDVLKGYVQGFISDSDYADVERQILDIIRAERRIALRAPRKRGAVAVLLALCTVLGACGGHVGSPLAPSAPGPVAPDPIVIEGSRNACVPVDGFYQVWRVYATDGRPRAFEAVAYRAPAAGCEMTTDDPAPVRPIWSPSQAEATYFLAGAVAPCGRTRFVLRVDGVEKAALTVNTGVSC